MKFAVIVFPGSNCDVDMYHAIKDELGEQVEYVWHDTESLEEFDGSYCQAVFPTVIICVQEPLHVLVG